MLHVSLRADLILGLVSIVDLPQRQDLRCIVVAKPTQYHAISESLLQLCGGGQFILNACLYPPAVKIKT